MSGGKRMILMHRNIPVAKLHMDNGIPIRYEEIYSLVKTELDINI